MAKVRYSNARENFDPRTHKREDFTELLKSLQSGETNMIEDTPRIHMPNKKNTKTKPKK